MNFKNFFKLCHKFFSRIIWHQAISHSPYLKFWNCKSHPGRGLGDQVSFSDLDETAECKTLVFFNLLMLIEKKYAKTVSSYKRFLIKFDPIPMMPFSSTQAVCTPRGILILSVKLIYLCLSGFSIRNSTSSVCSLPNKINIKALLQMMQF